jgi:hypothetical protein
LIWTTPNKANGQLIGLDGEYDSEENHGESDLLGSSGQKEVGFHGESFADRLEG